MVRHRKGEMGTEDATSPLPIHPGIQVLNMPNGLTAWVLRHSKPAGAVAMCLHVGVGSLREEEAERGASHMLEHLAFAGGASFPPGELERFFDSLGARLGRDCNAFTGLERTCYTFLLPDSSDQALERGLASLADFACGMSLLPDAVERERRVILEEMRQHQDAKTRIRSRILSLLLPDSLIAERHPLGKRGVVRSITLGQLRSYYSRWYRPDNSTVLVVGDVDPEQVGHSIHRNFGGWSPPVEPLFHPQSFDASVRSHLTAMPQAVLLTESGFRDAQVRLVNLMPTPPLQTVGRLRSWLQEEMIFLLFQRRLATQMRDGRAAFRNVRLSASPLVAGCELVQAVASGPPEKWQDILKQLLHELRRARLHGFSAAEIAEAREPMLAVVRRGDREHANTSSGQLLEEMIEAVPTGRPPMSAAQKCQLLEEVLPDVTPRKLRRRFSRIDPSDRLMVAILPEAFGSHGPSQQDLQGLLERAKSDPIEPPVAQAKPLALMNEEPKLGSVAREQQDQELGISTLTFTNGVRVHLRGMESGTDRVCLKLILAGGRIREHEGNLGVTGAAALPFIQPSTHAVSSSEIHRLMAAEDILFRCTVEEDALVFDISSNSQGLEEGLRLLHLLLTRPRIEEAALDRWRSQISESHQKLEARLSLEALRLLTGDDPRFWLISSEQALAISRDQAEQWLRKLCRSPLEAAIVGNVESQRIRSMVLRYLGSLPQRPLSDPSLNRLRRLEPDQGPLEARSRVVASAPRAAILNGWRAAPWQATDHRRLLGMASRILNRRLHQEVREKQGLTYNAESTFTPSKAYPSASLFSVAFYTPPDRVTEAATLTRELVQRLATAGPSETEMEMVRKQLSELAKRAEKEPLYWCRVLADSCYRGLRLESLKDLPARYRSYTGDELQAALGLYVTEQRRLSVSCLPLDSRGRGQS